MMREEDSVGTLLTLCRYHDHPYCHYCHHQYHIVDFKISDVSELIHELGTFNNAY